MWVVNEAINSYKFQQEDERLLRKQMESTQNKILRCIQQQEKALESFSKMYQPVQVTTGK